MGMNKGEIQARVIEVVRDNLGVEPDVAITMDTNMYAELGADSLSVFEITMEVEDLLGIQAPDNVNPQTIGELMEIVFECVPDTSCAAAK